MTSPLRIETLDELIEIIEGVKQDLEPVALGWAAPHFERFAEELRECDLRASLRTVAALFVDPVGPYSRMPGVECWDAARDATLYAGPHPVVAHPPCARWCKMAKQIERKHGYRVGDDGGLFAAALAAVRRWGGVLEHPAWSLAWPAYGLTDPPATGWARTLHDGEWVCEIAQSAYGCLAKKPTWLLLVGAEPPRDTNWAKPRGTKKLTHFAQRHTGDFNDTDRGHESRMSAKETHLTPPAFAEFLVRIARSTTLGLERTA
jgi:hypothetical protein